jgi:hypothetical protein
VHVQGGGNRGRERARERGEDRQREQGVLVVSPGGLLNLKRQAGGGIGGELLFCHAPAREEDKRQTFRKPPGFGGFSRKNKIEQVLYVLVHCICVKTSEKTRGFSAK